MSKAIQVPNEVFDKASLARREVNGFLLRQIGEMLCAGPQVKRYEENGRAYWQVSVWVATPDRGMIQEIGELRVDVSSGEVIADDSACDHLRDKARVALSQ